MKALYLECPTGISGDMFLGALIHLGVDIDYIQSELNKINLSNYSINVELVKKNSLQGIKFNVNYSEEQPHRHLRDIVKLIETSPLNSRVKKISLDAFQLLASAEAKIHGTSVEKVHFHEVGAIDSIIDIVGAAIALDLLDVEFIYSSPVPLGNGFVHCQHGLIPVPAPATLELIQQAGIPITQTKVQGELVGELVTPTGAALLAVLVKEFGSSPLKSITQIGYGAGSKDLPIPNLLRVTLGEIDQGSKTLCFDEKSFTSTLNQDEVILLETNIDDMNPEYYPFLFEKALSLGALDIFLTPVIMKKGRPGNILTVVCHPSDLDKMTELILKETSSLGIRYRREQRFKSYKHMITTQLNGQHIKVKYTTTKDNVILNIAPEYEDCKNAALATGISLKEIYDEVKSLARRKITLS